MIVLILFAGYVIVSAVLYLILREKCRKSTVFRMPKSRRMFYLLSLTWGLPTTALGAVIALGLRLTGHKPQRYGWGWCFELPGIRWGLELGLFFIAPAGYEVTHMHEVGHAIQNIYLGPFNLPVVFIPSAARFWYREFRRVIGRPCGNDYDGIWFEGSATACGKEFIRRLTDGQGKG